MEKEETYNPMKRTVNKIRYTKYRNSKNNDIVASMYAMYGTGKSLADIGIVYKKTRQAVHELFRARGYKLRSKKLKGLTFIDGFQFTENRDGYLRGTVNGKRLLAHQYIWAKANGEIPPDHVLHHIDLDLKNNNLENLKLVHKSKMGETFNPQGRNQYSIMKKLL